jgi:membrane associated rhomboid family serine protease
MIPLRSTERVHSRSAAVLTLIAVNIAMFAYEFALSPMALDRFVTTWGIVPDQLRLTSIATSMFLHGGWIHLLGNMLFLWVYGRNVEELIGSARFALFYLVCGMLAAVVHILTNPYSRIPTIGASGAIAGVMGAFLMKFPRARMTTLVFVFVFVTTMEIPAMLLLLYWFAIQFLSGVGSLATTDYTGGGVAWFAHIGGFIAGMVLIRFFPERRRWRPWYEGE